MNRKLSNWPCLISLSNTAEIPKSSVIDSPTVSTSQFSLIYHFLHCIINSAAIFHDLFLQYVIGRALDCNLIILKKSVSRKHATLNFNDEASHWTITSHVEVCDLFTSILNSVFSFLIAFIFIHSE